MLDPLDLGYGPLSAILPTNFHPPSRSQTNVNPLGPSMKTVCGSPSGVAPLAGGGVVDPNATLRISDAAAVGDFQPSTYLQPVPCSWTSRKARPLESRYRV